MYQEAYYMNPPTGSVDTLDGWYPYTPEKDGLIRVVQDTDGDWVDYTVKEEGND